MTNVELCKNILKKQGNNHTKVVALNTNRGGYYSYINDSIYITSDNLNDRLKNIVVICHECIHSTQSKYLHIANMVASNLEILAFILAILNMILGCATLTILMVYMAICIISIAIRCALEIPAMVNSFEIAKKFCCFDDIHNICNMQKQIGSKFFIGVLSFSWTRVFRMFLAIVVYCVI